MDSSDVAAAKTSLRRNCSPAEAFTRTPNGRGSRRPSRRSSRPNSSRGSAAARSAASPTAKSCAFTSSRGSKCARFRHRPTTDPRAPLRVVALYLSFATEPGTGPLIDWLADQRVRALAPTLLPDADLGWMEVPDGPPLGLDAITDAGVILVPALAVDRSGHRLGRGGGSYDRALTRVRPGQTVLAVVHDDEVLDAVPVGPHDRIVDGALTSERGAVLSTAADG